MAEGVLELTEDNFDSTVASGTTLVDFWAPWCGPCRMQGPIVESLAAKGDHGARICKVNVDEAPNVAAKYDIASIPTILIFKDGEIVEQLVGLRDEETLLRALKG